MSYLRVTARLCSPLAGDAPHLDGLLEKTIASQMHQSINVDRRRPAPPLAAIPIPIVRERVGVWQIAKCSSPILAPAVDSVEYYTRNIDSANADLLAPASQKRIVTSSTWTKSHRLPLRVRHLDRVVWFCEGSRNGVRSATKSIYAIGKKTSQGFGRVASWEVFNIDNDYSWFAMSDEGLVLMRPLPIEIIAEDVIGYRRWFGACCPPYFHPDRKTEIGLPC